MRSPALAVLAVLLVVALPAGARAESGAEVFKAKCARCHGEGGASDTRMGRPLKVAPLVNDARLARMSTSQIVELVRSDPKHRGVVHLKDAELAATARFVKELASRPNPAGVRAPHETETSPPTPTESPR